MGVVAANVIGGVAGEPSPELAKASEGAREPTLEFEGLREPRRGAGEGWSKRLLLVVGAAAELGVEGPFVIMQKECCARMCVLVYFIDPKTKRRNCNVKGSIELVTAVGFRLFVCAV